MSSTSEPLQPRPTSSWLRDAKVISIVAVAHFVSHVYIMLLPPIFLLVKDHFGVGYTEIALALTAYNVMSALLQTPAGFLVDRIGARVMLTGGLILERHRDLRRGPAAGLLVLPDRLRAARRRQHRLSPGRLFDPVGHGRRQAHGQGLLDPHLRGLPRQRRDARPGGRRGRAVGLERRLHLRGGIVLRRGAAADGDRQRAAARPAQGRGDQGKRATTRSGSTSC